ncbi:MAG: DUF1385 domain-containing protein [Chloroflexaceae bacterium]|nr:DUF1385 domain-containing protein [Chloroflexaceae bacterium]
MDKKQFSYGGQAVLEGVMMRGQHQATVAVRDPSGEIAYKHFPLDVQKRARWERLPLIRGVVLLWDTLNLGTRALNFSAGVVSGEQEAFSKKTSIGAMLVALAFAVGLFFVTPLLLASLSGYLGASLLLREILEGGVRLALVVGYVVLVGRIPEIQRVFGYHGAEHKTVNAYEAGSPLTVASVRHCSLIHPRCGTSFLVVVVVISFGVFLLLGGLPLWVRVLSRVVLVPLIAAGAYELLRLLATHYHRPWVRVLAAPALFFQKLTTREPDDLMIATAIAALRPVLAADGVVVQEKPRDDPMLAVSA